MNSVWFAAILLIFCNCMARGTRSRDSKILAIAMGATVVADFNMLITGNLLWGLYAFCGVQMLYCCRYAGARLCAALVLVWGLMPLPSALGPLERAGVMYAAALAMSLSAALAKSYPYPYDRRVKWGMGLFACCDLLVAAEYFTGAAYPLMWLFYLPSQWLLSCSGTEAA